MISGEDLVINQKEISIMSVSTDGQICFGVAFEEDYEFPWNQEKYSHDIHEWWLYEVLKYKPSFEIYDKNGEYIGGKKPSQDLIDQYCGEIRNFKSNNPKLPIKLVLHCSDNCPMYIIAIPETYMYAYRGYAMVINPESLKVTSEQVKELVDFCIKYLDCQDPPQWYLTSYWG